MVDDASGSMLCQFSAEERVWAAARLLRSRIERYGIPRALYTDWKNVYLRTATEAERRAGGRVERAYGTHQDRLIKKVRRKGIDSYEAANEYPEKEYLPARNRRFAVSSSSAGGLSRSQADRSETG
jgi:hypothetical protein